MIDLYCIEIDGLQWQNPYIIGNISQLVFVLRLNFWSVIIGVIIVFTQLAIHESYVTIIIKLTMTDYDDALGTMPVVITLNKHINDVWL